MFNIDSFDIKLDTEKIGRNFIYCDEVTSSNSVLLDPATGGAIHGTTLLTEKQTMGRGRKDRIWYSTKEYNLTFSILLNEKKYFQRKFNLLSLAASLAVALTIENMFQLKTELKWPNDVLINRKKVSGILIESSSKGNKIERVVIGIGLNVNQTVFQGNFNIEPTSIKLEINHMVEREILLAEFLTIFEELLESILSKPKWILKEWKVRCEMIGERISITEGDEIKYGILDDIDDDGFLILKEKNKSARVFSGDVSLV